MPSSFLFSVPILHLSDRHWLSPGSCGEHRLRPGPPEAWEELSPDALLYAPTEKGMSCPAHFQERDADVHCVLDSDLSALVGCTPPLLLSSMLLVI